MHINEGDLNKVMDALMSRDEAQCLVAQSIIVNAKDGRAEGDEIERARNEYANDECEIDDEAGTSRSDEGTWVQAWVWLAAPTCEDCGELEDACSCGCKTCAASIETRCFPCDECGAIDEEDSEDEEGGMVTCDCGADVDTSIRSACDACGALAA